MSVVHPETADPEAYPTRRDLVRAGVLAAFTGLTGFALTFALFVRPQGRLLDLSGLDRRGAERPQPAAYTDSRSGTSVYSFPYAPAGSSPNRLEGKKLALASPQPRSTTPRPVPKQSPQPAPVSLPLPEQDYQRGSSRPRGAGAAQAAVAPAAPLRLRPEVVGYSEAWRKVALGWVTFGDANRVGGEGVVVAEGEVLTTLSAFHFTGGRGYLAGQFINARLEAADPNLDLALLRIEGGGGVPIPLSPDSSSAGDLLVCGDVLRPGGFQEVRSRGPAGSGLGYYGWNSAQAGGSPLVNDRGEVVALSLPRPEWNSMSWNVAVPATQLQGFLNARPAPTGRTDRALENWCKAFVSHAPAMAERTRPTRSNARVIPGQAMGNFPLGMTAAQLQDELGAGQVLEKRGSLERRLYSVPRLTFTLIEGRTVAVETDYSFYALEGGWSVGTRLEPDALRTRIPGVILRPRGNTTLACAAGVELLLQGDVISTLRVVAP